MRALLWTVIAVNAAYTVYAHVTIRRATASRRRYDAECRRMNLLWRDCTRDRGFLRDPMPILTIRRGARVNDERYG